MRGSKYRKACCSYLSQLMLPLGSSGLITKSMRYIPKADIGALWLGPEQQKFVSHLLDPFNLITVVIVA